MTHIRCLVSALFMAIAFGAVSATSCFAAAPALELHVHSPETVTAGRGANIIVVLNNSGDAPYAGPITFTDTFPAGFPPVEPAATASTCSISGQTLTCTLPAEGIPPNGQIYFSFTSTIEAGASGTHVNRVTASGGGALEEVSEEESMTVGPPRPFAFQSVRSIFTNSEGGTDLQAGSAPAAVTTGFDFRNFATNFLGSFSITSPVEQFRNTIAHIPAGLVGNPNALPAKCTAAQLAVPSPEAGHGEIPNCPRDSQVGIVRIARSDIVPLYSMVPAPGTPAEFGFQYEAVPTTLTARLRPDDYGIDLIERNTNTTVPVDGAEVTVWGVPADPSHNTLRGLCLDGLQGNNGGTCTTAAPRTAFLRLPTSCPNAPLPWSLEADSYQHPNVYVRGETSSPAPIGCNQLEFTPTVQARPTTNVADSPSGFEFSLHLPQNDDPDGLAEANLKDAVVHLPAGLNVNAASANGLAACSPAQIGLTTAVGQTPAHFNAEVANCPDASKLGSVEVDTPVIDHPLPGLVYLARQNENPFHSLLALYIAINDPKTGVVVKIPARVESDPVTGRLSAAVEESPQLPFEDLHLTFDPGPHASLKTPPTCGVFVSHTVMTPWTSPEGAAATPSDSFEISKGANGSSCVDSEGKLPNSPSFGAGTLNPKAGAYSPFALKIVRADGSQQLRAIDTTLPPGLIGRLAGTSYCSDVQLAAAAVHSGAAEQVTPSCPSTSRVGSVNVGAGAGPSPFYAKGTAYLAGPYKGARLSLAVVTPAVAGPFDLGTVVVRIALYVNTETAQIHAVSDPIPSILQGIPLDVRSVALTMDRPNFTLNPTSCDPMSITAIATSVFDQSAALANPFQVGGCADLGFRPKLAIHLKGGTKRNDNPKLRAVLTARPGDANISRAQVTLPHSEFLDNAHIRTVCTRIQFAASACPTASIYGYARAITPLLDRPLEGPVYLRSSSNELPDLVAALNGQLEIDLDGRIDTGKNDGLRSTFEVVPDAPVSKFVLEMKGGKKGLLVNSTNLCRSSNHAVVLLEAQNGQTADQSPIVTNGCRSKHKQHKQKKH